MYRTKKPAPDGRPDYWNPADPLAAILVNVKGQRRREMIADIVTGQAADAARAAGLPPEAVEGLSEVEPRYLDDELDTPGALGQIHPTFLGGEYLPGYLPGEVEIARLVLASSTMDVYSIRARRRGARIHYRVLDEYEGWFGWSPKSSKLPLTEREMIAFIDGLEMDGCVLDLAENRGRDFLTAWWEFDAAQQGNDPETLEAISQFITVESVFYPNLTEHYQRQGREWVKRKTRTA